MPLPREIEGRWRTGVVLKRDVFSTVERGRFRTDDGEVEAVLRRIDEVPWWSFPLARHLFGARAPGARRRRRARRRAAALLCRAPRAGARLDRRRRAASRQAPRRPRLFPLRQGGAAQAAPCRHLPQRSRQGAELAARQRWPRLSDRFSARHAVQAPQPAVPDRRLRGPAPSPEAQAPLCARSDHAPRSGACSRARACSPASGWRPASRSTTG